MPLPDCVCVAGQPMQQQLGAIYCALNQISTSSSGSGSSSTASLSDSVFYDNFSTNSATIDGRVSPTGQVWKVARGSTPGAVAEVAGGVMQLAAGHLTDTIYPYVTLDEDVSIFGAEIQWANNNVANPGLSGPTLMVCLSAEALGSTACFHLQLSQEGAAMQWCPNGVFGAGVVTVSQAVIMQTAQVWTVQLECDKAEGTARFYGPGFSLELSGLTIPDGLRDVVSELTSSGGALRSFTQYTRVWANPPRPDILGQTSLQYTQTAQAAGRGWFKANAGSIAAGLEGGFWTYDNAGIASMITQININTNRGEMILPRDGNGLTLFSGATGFAEFFPVGQISNFGTMTVTALRVGTDIFGTYNGLNTGVKGTAMTIIQHGVATLAGGTVVVGNAYVTANTRIFLTSQSDGGTPGWLRVSARVANASFTITSSSILDTSTVGYLMIEP